MMNDKVHMGHRARKRFGQNFLHDELVIDQIVSAIYPQRHQHLVEIGPGLGALTGPVCDMLDKLHVVELDRDLATRLAEHPILGPKLVIHQADAMKFDFSTLVGPGQQLRVFGNLPYNISTPLIFHLFRFAHLISDMHFMLQKEVVQRLAAGPGSKTYGRLSVMAQYYCKVIPVLEVPPDAFRPAPKVDSAVVRLEPYAEPPYLAEEPKLLERVVTQAFTMRRKTLRNCFKGMIGPDELDTLGINPTQRPEQVSLPQFVAIANYINRRAAL